MNFKRVDARCCGNLKLELKTIAKLELKTVAKLSTFTH